MPGLHARALPAEEWPRLEATELAPVWPLLTADTARILVVERGEALVGCWALLPIWHLEGCWVAPEERARGTVARTLLRSMAQWIAEAQLAGVMTAATTPDVAAYLTRLGARPLPGQAFVWPRKESDRCLPPSPCR